jgi:hypothetical protein
MGIARHPLPPELVGVTIEDIMKRYVGRFRDRKPDWAAFEDAKIEGYKRGSTASSAPAVPASMAIRP